MRIMLDLETMGTFPGCPVVQIGAVDFTDPQNLREFGVRISLESCMEAGLVCEPNAIRWWMRQDEYVRCVSLVGTVPLSEALFQFKVFLGCDVTFGLFTDPNEIWAGPASFDFPILSAAYRAIRRETPWEYKAERCYRTIRKTCQVRYELTSCEQAVSEVLGRNKHDAIFDAHRQVITLLAIERSIRQKLGDA